MARRRQKLLFLLFLLSGFCGLLYQVVWMRQAFAAFGVITPVLSVVISVFMFGLFVGSWLAGKVVGPLTRKTGLSAIWCYAAAEILIGLSAFAVPRLLAAGEAWLLAAGEADSFGYLTSSGLILAAVIFPWCVFMGTTFPFMMAFVKEQDQAEEASFSFLYLANVIGAMAGTLVTALALVELLGFGGTLLVGAGINFSIALLAVSMGLKHPRLATGPSARSEAVTAPAGAMFVGSRRKLTALILFTSGFTSMAMEVAWTRAFTAALQTQIYAFAALLFTYLLATWVGSWLYRRHLAAQRFVPTARLIAWLAIGAVLPIAMNDPRIFQPLLGVIGDKTRAVQIAAALISILPFCAGLGYLTPKLIDGYSGGRPDAAGFSYAINILGCILGPLFASYLLLPTIGIKYTLLALAAPYAALLAMHLRDLPQFSGRREAVIAVACLALATVVSKTYEDQVQDFRGAGFVHRDHTATVIAYGEGMKKRLLVNGVGMTHQTSITKVMAHLPLALLKQPPKSALAICFGMGTTFRALSSWGIDTTAVELVPGVKEAFPYFFADAAEIVRRPDARIVVDDGRRFLRRSGQLFDVITLDPPPPVEAAGSSLLYSDEFYVTAKARLKPSGILQQWLPRAEVGTARAVARTLLSAFPYVRMYGSFEGWGYHFVASREPIEVPAPEALAARMPERARANLVEWMESKDVSPFLKRVLAEERDPQAFIRGGEARITDDRPYNEYWLLRTTLGLLSGKAAVPSAPSR